MGRDIISSLEQQNSVLGKDFKINGYRIGCFSLSWGSLKNTYSKAPIQDRSDSVGLEFNKDSAFLTIAGDSEAFLFLAFIG